MSIEHHAQRFVCALHSLERCGEQALPEMLDLFADDAKIANAALTLAHEERRGGEDVRTFWSDYCKSLPGASTTFHALTLGERQAGLFWTTRGAGYEYEGASLLAYDERGKISAFRGYYDTRRLEQRA